jgi:hypothetical protein
MRVLVMTSVNKVDLLVYRIDPLVDNCSGVRDVAINGRQIGAYTSRGPPYILSYGARVSADSCQQVNRLSVLDQRQWGDLTDKQYEGLNFNQ